MKTLTIGRVSACDDLHQISPGCTAGLYLRSQFMTELFGVPDMIITPPDAVFFNNGKIAGLASGCDKIDTNSLLGNIAGNGINKFRVNFTAAAKRMNLQRVHIITSESDVMALTGSREEVLEGRYKVMFLDDWNDLHINPAACLQDFETFNLSVNNVLEFAKDGFSKEQIKKICCSEAPDYFEKLWALAKIIRSGKYQSWRFDSVLEDIDKTVKAMDAK